MDWDTDMKLQKRMNILVDEGYKQKEILHIISREFPAYAWSGRTLTRRLRHFKIQRNDKSITAHSVLTCVKEELNGPGQLLGYRAMYKKIRMKYGLRVKMKQVYLAMTLLDQDGFERRKLVNKRKKFHRREFTSKGPNWVWSVDGHDKLMGWHKNEYPMAIHGCVDTFSRKIIWLRAWPSNSSPKIPARFYYETVREKNVIPQFIRSDRGNENTTLFVLHNYLRKTVDGSSYLYGSSTANQVIERWWRDLRERNGNVFRSYLESLTETGLYNSGNEHCKVILAVLLIPVLQRELDTFRDCWNSHRIRRQNIRRPCGIPNFLYGYPEACGFKSAGFCPDKDRMVFVNNKPEFLEKFDFVPAGVRESITGILKKGVETLLQSQRCSGNQDSEVSEGESSSVIENEFKDLISNRFSKLKVQ